MGRPVHARTDRRICNKSLVCLDYLISDFFIEFEICISFLPVDSVNTEIFGLKYLFRNPGIQLSSKILKIDFITFLKWDKKNETRRTSGIIKGEQ